MEGPLGEHLLVDGHVHFHESFDPRRFLDAAHANLRTAAERRDLPEARGCLLFTESRGVTFFRSLRDGAVRAEGWRFSRTAEAESLFARRREGGRVLLVAGRQVVTTERLEVLAIGVDADFEDGQGLRETVDVVGAADGVPVIPWGFGKWTGRRGKLVAAMVETAAPGRLFLGDNGGRLSLGATPELFAVAEDRRVPVLPGSDPLPFPDQVDRVGSYGFVLPGPPDPERPAAWVKARLRELRESPSQFGRLESLPRFCRYQVAMQLRRFRRG